MILLIESSDAPGQEIKAMANSCRFMETPECKCYSQRERDLIASKIKDLALCEFSLEQYKTVAVPPPPPVAFWQDPSFVVGGLVVSFSVGVAAGVVLSRRR
jgi:hypothetical protein